MGRFHHTRDKRTAPIRAASAAAIRPSEIAMATVSTRSSRRSFASALARCCDTLESSDPGGGIPLVLKQCTLSKTVHFGRPPSGRPFANEGTRLLDQRNVG